MAADTAVTFTGPELCKLTARDAVALLKKGEIAPDDLIDAALARIAQTSPAINAMVTVCEDRARAKAAEVSRDSLLAGLPLGIKDLNAVEGVRTTWGNTALAEFVPEASDPLVLRIEANGGVVLGKTNTPEMGAGANTFNEVFGRTRNPWNTVLNPGGSSGGAAASLATGETWLSHGSDLGGSLRTPASFCGVVGMRASYGVAGGGSDKQGFDGMPTQGPMARNVADLALFLDAMSGFDPIWPVSFPAPETSYLDACLRDPGPVRIAFSPDLGGVGPVTPMMAETLRRGMEQVAAAGIDVVEATPHVPGIVSCFRAHRALGMWAGAKLTPDAVKSRYKATLRGNIEDGRNLTVDQIADAMNTRSQLYDSMRIFMQDYDVLACPVSGIEPLKAEIEYPPEINGIASTDYVDWLCFAMLATLCGLPSMSLPIGFLPTGTPIGIQLIGRPRGEARLLQVARRIEEHLALQLGPIDPITP
jgi:amidase